MTFFMNASHSSKCNVLSDKSLTLDFSVVFHRISGLLNLVFAEVFICMCPIMKLKGSGRCSCPHLAALFSHLCELNSGQTSFGDFTSCLIRT